MRLASEQDWEMWRQRRWFAQTLANNSTSHGLRVNTEYHNRWPIPGVPANMILTVVHFDQSGDCLFKVTNGEIGNRCVERSYVTETPDEAAAVLAAVPFLIQRLPRGFDRSDPAHPENLKAMWTGARPYERE